MWSRGCGFPLEGVQWELLPAGEGEGQLGGGQEAVQRSLGAELVLDNVQQSNYVTQAHLTSIGSEEENTFLSEMLASKKLEGEYWVGGRRNCQNCKSFSWTDGTEWSYQDFQNKRKGDCVQAGKGWRSASCEEEKTFVCKY